MTIANYKEIEYTKYTCVYVHILTSHRDDFLVLKIKMLIYIFNFYRVRLQIYPT